MTADPDLLGGRVKGMLIKAPETMPRTAAGAQLAHEPEPFERAQESASGGPAEQRREQSVSKGAESAGPAEGE
jgi:hypothetical protein